VQDIPILYLVKIIDYLFTYIMYTICLYKIEWVIYWLFKSELTPWKNWIKIPFSKCVKSGRKTVGGLGWRSVLAANTRIKWAKLQEGDGVCCRRASFPAKVKLKTKSSSRKKEAWPSIDSGSVNSIPLTHPKLFAFHLQRKKH